MRTKAYYNEIDPFAAQWLRNLIAAGLIAPGDVDERSIEDVRPDDLRGYTQCHFFAGIGVWSYALRLAGWPDDRPVWTGSCPCPPFSSAGKGQRCPECGSARNLCHPRKTGHFVCLDCGCDRHADGRHLWPEFSRLIRERGPSVVFGEQVASADGRLWLDVVSADLENASYGVAGADTCSAGSGAPHIRQRLRFVAERVADSPGRLGDNNKGLEGYRGGHQAACGRDGTVRPVTEAGELGGLADADGRQLGRQPVLRGVERDRQDAGWPEGRGGAAACGNDGGLADADSTGSQPGKWNDQGARHGYTSAPTCDDGRVANAAEFGRERRGSSGESFEPGALERSSRLRAATTGQSAAGPTNGFWRDADWLFCRDGKWRPVEPGTFPLAHGASARVGRLRAYGNAIDAEATKHFIEAYIDASSVGF